MTSEALAGRRLIVLLFDISSMQPEDVQRAVDSARKYVKEQMSAADLVAVATVGSTLDVLTDFTGERERVDAALGRLAYTEGTATDAAGGQHRATDEAAAAAEEPASTEASELDMFNNDVRLRALRTLAETLSPIEQKKAIVYFSAGMQRSGQDNQVELRAAVNASVRAHVAIYPIDIRGLQAVVPGGDARQASGRGQDMFSGPRHGAAVLAARLVAGHADVARRRHRRPRLHRHQRLRRGVHARAARHVGVLPARLQQHQRRPRTAASGASRCASSATACASRRAPATTPHATSPTPTAAIAKRSWRSSCWSAVSATDLPVLVTGGFFRLAADRYYVPITVAIPGSAVPVPRRQGQGHARRARHRPRRAGPAGRPHPPDDGSGGGSGSGAREQAGAVSVGRHAAAGPLRAQGRGARERQRRDRLVRERRSPFPS